MVKKVKEDKKTEKLSKEEKDAKKATEKISKEEKKAKKAAEKLDKNLEVTLN